MEYSDAVERLKHAIVRKDFNAAGIILGNFDLPKNKAFADQHEKLLMEVDIYLNGITEQIKKMYLYEKLDGLSKILTEKVTDGKASEKD